MDIFGGGINAQTNKIFVFSRWVKLSFKLGNIFCVGFPNKSF